MTPRKLLVHSILVTLIGLGGWCTWRWYTTPMPPVVPLEGTQLEMVELIEQAREMVRREPRSGETWGRLAMILSANGFISQASDCFLCAERFDHENPRWPYLHGSLLLEERPHMGIPLLRRSLQLAQAEEERATILFRLAAALVENGQLDEAEQHMQSLRVMEG